MRAIRIILSPAIAVACGIAVQAPASAQENRGTYEQQMACTPDVWRLCFDQIPDVNPDHDMPAAKHAAAFRGVPRGV